MKRNCDGSSFPARGTRSGWLAVGWSVCLTGIKPGMRGPRLAGTASYSGKSSGVGRRGGATGLGSGWRETGGKAVTGGGGGLFTGGKEPAGAGLNGGTLLGDPLGESVSFSVFWNSNGSYWTTGGV